MPPRRADAAAIADDSGLEVDALGGAPGIYSARYAGVGADDGANNAKLARRAQRQAACGGAPGTISLRPGLRCGSRRRCAIDGRRCLGGRYCEFAARLCGGFGYDPYFWLPELKMTAAELDPADKNRRSHRGIALRALREQLAVRERQAARR